MEVTGLDELTGLPEYRNGGLLIDAGVIVPRDAGFAAQPRLPSDPWVIEWRALTVALLDELAPRVRAALGDAAAQLPLACILEGGTWAAGRQIAAEKRPGGAPPVTIDQRRHRVLNLACAPARVSAAGSARPCAAAPRASPARPG